ncbi:DUF1772 domain-containing protein [Mycolicibacter icosiumassiliensis]|uniref:DUF1772 domain-containing protein n=1 Tax=Mycolicibacter icosiumassiliensis TaxID=1792835 RepID=UPI0008372842|nr:DUF1772 domain-containing protein [Mycolicibacter icosiumassiliensis]
MTRFAPVAGFAAVLFSGMFAGFLTAVLVLEVTLRRYGGDVYTQVRLIELEHLDDLATALLLPAILAAAVLTITMTRRTGDRRLVPAAAVALLTTSLLISVVVSVPINTEQLNWTVSSPPGDWATVRDRWQVAHLARTTTAVLAFALLTSATVPLRWSRRAADHHLRKTITRESNGR